MVSQNLSTLVHVKFFAWWHQAITWTHVDLTSEVFHGIHLRAISQEALMNLICNIHLEFALFKN